MESVRDETTSWERQLMMSDLQSTVSVSKEHCPKAALTALVCGITRKKEASTDDAGVTGQEEDEDEDEVVVEGKMLLLFVGVTITLAD